MITLQPTPFFHHCIIFINLAAQKDIQASARNYCNYAGSAWHIETYHLPLIPSVIQEEGKCWQLCTYFDVGAQTKPVL